MKQIDQETADLIKWAVDLLDEFIADALNWAHLEPQQDILDRLKDKLKNAGIY